MNILLGVVGAAIADWLFGFEFLCFSFIGIRFVERAAARDRTQRKRRIVSVIATVPAAPKKATNKRSAQAAATIQASADSAESAANSTTPWPVHGAFISVRGGSPPSGHGSVLDCANDRREYGPARASGDHL